jgi:signal transduction histidine kinase
MMPRLTFARRIGLIVVVGLGMAWLATLALRYVSRAPAGGVTPPAPAQIAALAELLERTPAAERPLVLQAVSTEIFKARMGTPTPPAPPRAWRQGQFDLGPYLAALDGRPISVNFVDRKTRRLLPRLLFPTPELRIVLRTQDVLVVDPQGELLLGPLGLPVGFGGGVLGTLIAFVTLIVMYREARPLARLARAVDGVDLSLNPALLPEAKRSAPEIRALIDAFNRLQGRLAELLRARMAMLGGISHDVRTFATRLRLRIDKIGDEAERDRAIADINDMIHLLDDALLASRAGAGELAEEMIEIDDVIRAEVADRQPGGMRIDYQAGRWQLPPIVLGDRLALRRVVANLADNAIKYGRVAHLTSRLDGSAVLIVVDDEGPGIPRDKRQAMLEPFSRLETSRSRGTGGAGLGLAIVRTLTEAHNGTLTIDDAPSGGARITVRLPLFQGG